MEERKSSFEAFFNYCSFNYTGPFRFGHPKFPTTGAGKYFPDLCQLSNNILLNTALAVSVPPLGLFTVASAVQGEILGLTDPGLKASISSLTHVEDLCHLSHQIRDRGLSH